jgi:hypothetical protein
MASAMPWPPSMHMVTIPRLRPSRRIEWMRLGCQHRAGGADRMPVGDRAAFDIDDVGRKPELARDGDDDRGEGFVDLDALDIAEPPPRPVERLTDGGDRPEAEHARLDRGDAVGDEARNGGQALSLRPVPSSASAPSCRDSHALSGAAGRGPHALQMACASRTMRPTVMSEPIRPEVYVHAYVMSGTPSYASTKHAFWAISDSPRATAIGMPIAEFRGQSPFD